MLKVDSYSNVYCSPSGQDVYIAPSTYELQGRWYLKWFDTTRGRVMQITNMETANGKLTFTTVDNQTMELRVLTKQVFDRHLKDLFPPTMQFQSDQEVQQYYLNMIAC